MYEHGQTQTKVICTRLYICSLSLVLTNDGPSIYKEPTAVPNKLHLGGGGGSGMLTDLHTGLGGLNLKTHDTFKGRVRRYCNLIMEINFFVW